MIDIVERCLRKAPAEAFANGRRAGHGPRAAGTAESRITVERARMAMGNTGRGPMVSSPLLASAETPRAPRPHACRMGVGQRGHARGGATAAGRGESGLAAGSRWPP